MEKKSISDHSEAIGAGVANLTKLCFPNCFNLEQQYISRAEKTCFKSCIKSFHLGTTSMFHRLLEVEKEMDKE